MECPDTPSTSQTDPQHQPASIGRGGWVGVVVVAGLLALVVRILLSYPGAVVQGEMRSTGEPLGDFALEPPHFYLGGHWGFRGAWIAAETQTLENRKGFRGGLKIVEMDDGKTEVYAESAVVCEVFTCRKVLLDRRWCRTLEVVLGAKKWTQRRSGQAAVDCTFPEGGTLRADLRFDGCAEVPPEGGDP